MAVEQSILKSTKSRLQVAIDDPSFDTELLDHINGALSDLPDLGIGPEEGFEITGDDEEWADLLGEYPDLNRVKTWLYLKVKLLFDPAQTSFHLESINKMIEQAEWRITNKEDRERSEQTT